MSRARAKDGGRDDPARPESVTTRRREARLRRSVLRGDEAAWGLLLHDALPAVERWLQLRLRDEGAARDCAQETWMVAVRRIRDFDPARGPFRAWARGIAARVVLAHERAASRLPQPVGEIAARDLRALGEAVGFAMEELPRDYRDVLVAKYLEGDDVRSIAGRLGRTPKAVEGLLTRARAAFRARWREGER